MPQRKARGEPEMSTPEFMRLIRDRAQRLGISPEMLKRPVNVGFSGGEKKRAEILQMAVLEPSMCIMDETDRVSTSTPCGSSLTASTGCAARTAR